MIHTTTASSIVREEPLLLSVACVGGFEFALLIWSVRRQWEEKEETLFALPSDIVLYLLVLKNRDQLDI